MSADVRPAFVGETLTELEAALQGGVKVWLQRGGHVAS